jgi:hypothetical protein
VVLPEDLRRRRLYRGRADRHSPQGSQAQ